MRGKGGQSGKGVWRAERRKVPHRRDERVVCAPRRRTTVSPTPMRLLAILSRATTPTPMRLLAIQWRVPAATRQKRLAATS